MGKTRAFFLPILLASLTISCSQNERNVHEDHMHSNPLVADSLTYDFINTALLQGFKEFNFPCETVMDRSLSFSLAVSDSLHMLSMDSIFSNSTLGVTVFRLILNWCRKGN